MTHSNQQSSNSEELIEKLAAIEHERWADWQKWCHKVLRENNPSPEQSDILERWDRQIETTYAELSEKEKQSDRDQVMRYWPLIQANYLPRKQVEAAVNTGQFIDPSKTSGELIEAFRRQISSKLGLTPNPTKPFKKGWPL